MKRLTAFSIIYNPNSKGSGEKLARELADQLALTPLKVRFQLFATQIRRTWRKAGLPTRQSLTAPIDHFVEWRWRLS